MKIAHLSASSVGTWDICNYAYKLSYEYKMKGFPNSGAIKGTICHAVFEDIANAKVNGEQLTVGDIYKSLDKHYKEESELEKNKKWVELTSADYNDCKRMINKVIDKNAYGFFNKKIIGVEKEFDILFDKTGTPITIGVSKFCEENDLDRDVYLESFDDGSFRVYGFIDLIVESNGVLEVLDWKSGKVTKKNDELKKDVQLRLYSLVAKTLYPEYSYHLVSIWYLRSRICSLGFEDSELISFAKEMSDKWKEIKYSNNPQRTISPLDKRWKCKFCAFKGGREDCDIFWLHDKNNKNLKELIEKVNRGETLKDMT